MLARDVPAGAVGDDPFGVAGEASVVGDDVAGVVAPDPDLVAGTSFGEETVRGDELQVPAEFTDGVRLSPGSVTDREARGDADLPRLEVLVECLVGVAVPPPDLRLVRGEAEAL